MLFIIFCFLLAARIKVFLRTSLSPVKEQSFRFAQCASSNILPYSRLVQATRSTGTGLNEKDKILPALFGAATSLWPQKVVVRSHLKSERAKLVVNFDTAKDF